MKLFIYSWSFITKHDLYQALNQQGIDYDLFNCVVSPRVKAQKEQFVKLLEAALEGRKYDAIFSINFYEELAVAAHDRGMLYVCWTYDSPALGALKPAHFYDTNRIFVFDSSEYEQYKKCDVPNLYYMPLAVNTRRLSGIKPTPMEQMKYRADVSFVGQLYQSDMDKMFPLFDEYSAGYIAAIINTQLNVWGKNIVKELINDNVIQRICNEQVTNALLNNLNERFLRDVNELKSWSFTAFLLKAVTNKERVLLLTFLAKYYHVKLYCPGNPQLPNVYAYGIVDYVEDMPKIFKCSKINLNITLRTIANGVPQRVIDIMGCGGLALTNYQEDIQKHFEDGKELLVYHSMEEAMDKCKFYLTHEKEAEKIRQNGYRLVKEKFSYECLLDQIWEISGLKDTLSN